MIERLPEDLLAPTQIPDKVNELVDAINRLTQLAKLGLSTGRDEKFPSTPEGDRQFAENRLTWPEDSRSPKGIERDIKRREKP